MILKLINGFHQQMGQLHINEKLNHHLYRRQKDPVCLIKYLIEFYFQLFILIGDASNFDDYEEEPRKKFF